ncbi:MAG: hypothetical protein LBC70_05630 [Chitinispirillales bacterium]|jgi:hypothetical protein|nr:hypothetical protein [Chitinispirillales bacterium]
MKVREIAFAIFGLLYMLYSTCVPPQKIEKYIEKNCHFEKTDTCYIDMRNVFKKNYDVMYVFHSSTRLKTVRDIMGIDNYRKWCRETTAVGYDSDEFTIILVKDGKVIARHFTERGFSGCTRVNFSDMCTNPIFKITETKCGGYRTIPAKDF